jgi:uncharacterized damage-inducible protein DinB
MTELHTGPLGEKETLLAYLAGQRASLLRKLDGLTDEQARSTPTASAFSLLGIVKHVAAVERRWIRAALGEQDEIPGVWPPGDRDDELDGSTSTIDGVRAFYAQVQHECAPVLDGVVDLDRPLAGTGMTARSVLVHLVEEVARHAGHADIIRESIDGAVEPPD